MYYAFRVKRYSVENLFRQEIFWEMRKLVHTECTASELMLFSHCKLYLYFGTSNEVLFLKTLFIVFLGGVGSVYYSTGYLAHCGSCALSTDHSTDQPSSIALSIGIYGNWWHNGKAAVAENEFLQTWIQLEIHTGHRFYENLLGKHVTTQLYCKINNVNQYTCFQNKYPQT